MSWEAPTLFAHQSRLMIPSQIHHLLVQVAIMLLQRRWDHQLYALTMILNPGTMNLLFHPQPQSILLPYQLLPLSASAQHSMTILQPHTANGHAVLPPVVRQCCTASEIWWQILTHLCVMDSLTITGDHLQNVGLKQPLSYRRGRIWLQNHCICWSFLADHG